MVTTVGLLARLPARRPCSLRAPHSPWDWRAGARVALAALALGLCGMVAAVWWQGTRDERRPAEAILVLGAAQWNGHPSPVLQARLDHAVELYQAGYAPRVVLTGGVGDGDVLSEATVAASYIHDRGVPLQALLLEERGRSSLESMRGAAAMLDAAGLSRVLLVSDPPHMLRVLRMAHALGLEAYGSPASDSPAVASLGSLAGFIVRETLLNYRYQWLAVAPPTPAKVGTRMNTPRS